jgi:hypothetical protein
MSSGIIPNDGSICVICWEFIPQGAHARDMHGDLWDAHTGTCAEAAGIQEPCGFVSPSSDDGYCACIKPKHPNTEHHACIHGRLD